MEPMRIFLTGGTGFLGSNIIKVALERYSADILTTVHRWQTDQPMPFSYRAIDITDHDAVRDEVVAYQPDVVIHSAILNDFGQMYQNRRLAWQTYVDSTRALCDAANAVGAKFIFVSTDWVYDGTQGPADETTPPNPVNYYGVLKVVGETIVNDFAPNGAIARVSGVSGTHWLRPNSSQTQNAGFGYFAAAVVNSLAVGEPFTVWEGPVNMRATPGLASENAEIILRIATGDQTGIFHCCAGESIGRFELAELIADVFDLDRTLLRSGPVPADDSVRLYGYRVPRDTSLDARWTAARLDYTLPSVRQLIEKYRTEVETQTLA